MTLLSFLAAFIMSAALDTSTPQYRQPAVLPKKLIVVTPEGHPLPKSSDKLYYMKAYYGREKLPPKSVRGKAGNPV